MSGSGDAFVTIQCDECGIEEIQINLTALATMSGNSWDDRNVKKELKRQGWDTDGNDWHCCPYCIEAAKEEAEEKEDNED